ncbi:uncharacterized protein [Dendrobates tinctorius]|uniref:uncharacterized protein n=1 Tax=Dendrobates tinctorius TaxID=92724 RepID=UPI003CC932C4
MRESRQLSNRFRERGYPRRIVSGAFEFSRNRPREEFLNPRMNAQVWWLEERRTSRIFCLTAILDVQLPRFAPIQPKAYFNCRSRNMVYALVCGCKKFYVGQTTQELRRRTQQHLSNIMTARADRGKGKPLTSVATHFLDNHGGSPDSLRVLGLEGVRVNIRGVTSQRSFSGGKQDGYTTWTVYHHVVLTRSCCIMASIRNYSW